MNIWWFAVLVMAVIGLVSAFVWLAINVGSQKTAINTRTKEDLIEEAGVSAATVFNEDFREELKNRGRLHFENIINENAMFLQHDLRLTTSQLNDFMKEEVKKVLREEFATYEESIATAKDQAITAIKQTQTVIEEQRKVLQDQLSAQVEEERKQAIARFENNMGQILNHYILEALGTEIDLTDQLDYIFAHLESNKQAIIEDVRHGA